MKVLITGAKGQVGSELVRDCQAHGLDFVAFGSKDLDITSQVDVDAAIKAHQPNVIINAAAYTAVDNAEDDRETAFAVNADGSRHLALAAKAVNAKLIHISTDYVFDGNKDGAYTVEDVPNPQNVYGESKLAGEQAIAGILDNYLIVRVAWVFGEFGNNFVKTMLKLAETRDELSVVNDQWGAPCPAKAISEFLLSPKALNELKGIEHCDSVPKVTWYDFATTIFEVTGNAGRVTVSAVTSDEFVTKARRPNNSMMQSDQFKVSWVSYLPLMLNSLEQDLC